MDTRPQINKIQEGLRKDIYRITSAVSLFLLPIMLLGLIFAPTLGYSALVFYIFLACLGGMCQLYDHIKFSFKTGWKIALAFLPITAGLLVVANRAIDLLENPILNYQISQGLLGTSTGTSEVSLVGNIITIVFMVILVGIGFPVFNFYEEYYFRKRWVYVPIWALLHLFLGFSGITFGALLVIFVAGIVFKIIFDRYGFQKAFVCHVLTNWTSIGVLIALSIL